MPHNDASALASLAKALGHPARIRIVQLLVDRHSCIGGDIVDEIGLAQSTVSEHLRILKESGVISGEIEHPRICYSLNPATLRELADWLGNVIGQAATQKQNCSIPERSTSHE